MKKRITALVLAAMLTAQTGYAAVLGSVITSWSHDIAEGTTLYKNEFLSEQQGVGRQTEYYVEYTPNASVVPTVVTGESVWGKRTVKEAEKYMKERGMVPMIGINASFFSFKTGVPMGHVISNGTILSKDTQEYPAIGFRADGSAFIAPLSVGTELSSGEMSVEVAHINKYNQTVTDVINLYTPEFGDNTHTDAAALNLILGEVSGELAIGGTLTAVVEEKFNYTGSIKIPEGKLILTLNEAGRADLYEKLNSLEIGDEVTISSSANDLRWNEAVSGLGSEGERLIADGQVQSGFAAGAAPRTAVGITENGNIIFYVIDGRQQGYSYGVQIKTLANRLKEFGCVDAINLDGGGSTVISGIYPGSDENAVLNSPSEGTLRSCTNYIFLENKLPPDGRAARLYLYPFEQHYLSGYSEQLYPAAADGAYYKTDIPEGVTYSASGESSIDENGVLTARGNGEFTVTAKAEGIEGSARYFSYTSPTAVDILNADTGREIKSLSLKKGDSVPLKLNAHRYYISLKSSPGCYDFEVTNGLGYVDEAGRLVITAPGGRGALRITAGEFVREIPITVQSKAIFSDTAGHWAELMINDVYENGIVSGYEGQGGLVFRPDNTMTREEFAVIMCRFLDVDVSEYEGYALSFADNAKISPWATKYVAAMADLGVINGKADGGKVNFAPADTLTRAEAMTILGRVLGGEAAEITFADSADIPEWARENIMRMAAQGFVSGYSDGTIRPGGKVTRAEAVTMIYKIMSMEF